MGFKLRSGAVGWGFLFNPRHGGTRLPADLRCLARSSLPPALAKPERFTVRMHLPDGTILPPKKDPEPWWTGITGGPEVGYTDEYIFPWTRNALDEAWVEVRMPHQTYWVEIPYGYTRNVFAPLAPAAARQGPPSSPPR